MNLKVVFRCILISLLLAAPAPLLLAGFAHLADPLLTKQVFAEFLVSGVASIYFAMALGSFVILLVGTLAAAALAPLPAALPTQRRVGQAEAPEPAQQRQETLADEEDDDEVDIIDYNDGREEGEVKWFNTNKGYGFITRDNGDDVFVHFRAIRGRGNRMLTEGQIVRYQVIHNERGLQADDVSIIE
ncbi:cold-shock protein [Halomonas sp. ZH2S]|uniref:Cold-shock protein n=1 Tax=Vreelandella zhuhanensis TaxID=2684210 RepID=A0A7X3KPD0_9GAMM|nr:cold-shock protein [Halomonas zhuhanensis]MWJ27359.1 cold-shock protein [Halomonas zhuhanensis]